jgi:hypothetical protein
MKFQSFYIKRPTVLADKEKRRTSLQVILPANTSIDNGSLNNSPPSPGL